MGACWPRKQQKGRPEPPCAVLVKEPSIGVRRLKASKLGVVVQVFRFERRGAPEQEAGRQGKFDTATHRVPYARIVGPTEKLRWAETG